MTRCLYPHGTSQIEASDTLLVLAERDALARVHARVSRTLTKALSADLQVSRDRPQAVDFARHNAWSYHTAYPDSRRMGAQMFSPWSVKLQH